jgi:hypothetical protein
VLRVQTGNLKSSEEPAADHVAFQTFLVYFLYAPACYVSCSAVQKGGNKRAPYYGGVASSTDANPEDLKRDARGEWKNHFRSLYYQ